MNERQERKAFKEATKLEALARANRDKFLQTALATREGRDYFYWLLGVCQIGQQPFTNNALSTAFNCGVLNVGQQVQAHIIETAPSMFLTMLTEQEEERKNAARGKHPNADSDASDTDSYTESDPDA